MKPLLAATRWQPPKAPNPTDPTRPIRVEVVALPGRGPEDILIDAEGRVVTGLEDGRIVRLPADGGSVEVLADTGGRPLGIEELPDGALLVCDAFRGLLRVSDGAVEPLVTEIDGRPLRFCSNALVDSDGTIYFTDSSTVYDLADHRAEVLAHTATGRLVRLSPDGSLTVLRADLRFANGLAFGPGESFLVVAETFGYRLSRLTLTGEHAGEWSTFAANLPGFPDNISTGTDGLIWVSLPTPRDRVLDLLLPHHPRLRELAFQLPARLQPQPRRLIWVRGYAPDGRLVHDLRAVHPEIALVTAVAEHDGTVWLGSLDAAVIGRFRLTGD
jgi:sugar lactone lactonase YvrE